MDRTGEAQNGSPDEMLTIPRSKCHGRGKRQDSKCVCTCPTCGGVHGTMPCESCGGRRAWTGSRKQFISRCRNCAGTGRTRCPTCKGNLRNPTCTKCHGTGGPTCSSCDGTGGFALAALPLHNNLFDFGAWATYERRAGQVATGIQIERAITRLSTEASAKYPQYRHKQSLDWHHSYAAWFDGITYLYNIYRVADDGFVIIMKHIDDDGWKDFSGYSSGPEFDFALTEETDHFHELKNSKKRR